MDLGLDKAKIMRYKALVKQRLSDPVKLRLATMGGLLVLVVGLVYVPLSKEIDGNKRLLAAEKERNGYIVDNEELQKQAATFRALIGEKSDTNEWVQYLLDGLRKFRVKLKTMEARQPRKIGPFQAIVFSMEIDGAYPEIRNYVEWLESSPRLIRIDALLLEKRSENLSMKISILGIMSKK